MHLRVLLRAALAAAGLWGCRRLDPLPHGTAAVSSPTAAPVTRCCTETVWEAAGHVDYAPLFDPGIYACAVCGQPLFAAEAKYEAHTPWPSFWQALPGAVTHGAVVIEAWRGDGEYSQSAVICANCGARLGDVYRDGPAPTGLRYCILSAALVFAPAVG